MFHRSSLLLLFCLLTLVAQAQAPPKLPPGVRQVTSVEGITEYQLQNGLKVLLFPDPSSSDITANITYLVGSNHEGYGEKGMAHLLEHLLFKGSKNHKNIPQELTAHGARPNGTTSQDRTNYFETFRATDENLKWALDLEADRMVNSFVAKKDLDSEMTVVRNEFESGENDPFGVLLNKTMSTAFLWHAYGQTTIGNRSDIEKVPIERLQAFYKRYYQPDNAMLIVAGKIDPARTLALVQATFGKIPKPTRKLIKPYTVEPTQDGERALILRRVGDIQAVLAAYHVPPGSHEDFAALDVMCEILSDTPSGRLYKALVESGKATAVFGGAFQLRDPGLALFAAQVRKDGPLSEVKDVLIQVVQEMPASEPTAEEVDRAKMGLLKSVELTLNSSERLALQLSEWEAMGDWRLFFLYRDRIEKVTAADVQRVAKAYLKTSNRTVGEFIPTDAPERASIPETGEPSAHVRGYTGRAAIAQGEAFDASPANIDKRTRVVPLEGGIEMALLPKKTRGETVFVSMIFRFGNLPDLQFQDHVAAFTGSMLMRGTKQRTREQIQDELDRLKARMSIGGSATSATVGIETTRANLPAVLRLAREVLREPSFPEAEFKVLMEQSIAGLESQKSEPETLASIASSLHMDPYPVGDPRHPETLDEAIANEKKVTLEQVKAFHQGFYGASNVQIGVVGDFDEEATQRLLTELFADWKSPKKFERLVNQYFDVTVAHESVYVPDKANVTILGNLNLKLQDTDPDYPALVLGNFLLGGGFLNSRLATRIRQKEGLSYGVGSSLSGGSLDPVGEFSFYAICAPENADKVEKAFREELQKVLDVGYTPDEVKAALAGYLQMREGNRAKDSSLTGKLASNLYLDRTMAWDQAFEDKLRKLTPDEIRVAMKKHIDPARISIFRSGTLPQK